MEDWSLKKILLFLFISKHFVWCVSVYTHTHDVCACLPEENIRSPGAEVTASCESPDMGAGN